MLRLQTRTKQNRNPQHFKLQFMKISILTLFPEMFNGPFEHSIIKRAKKKKLVTIQLINIRDFGIGKHKTVDDKPYGGGQGMILRVDVVAKAIQAALDKTLKPSQQKVILLSAKGKLFTQGLASTFSKLKHLILVCGHYEGVDERITKFIDYEISVGAFVTTGGEIPAMLVADAVTRLIPNVLKENVTAHESFSTFMNSLDGKNEQSLYLEYPQYTRPRVYKKTPVPDVLLSGDHKKITDWKKAHMTKVP